MSKLDFQVNLLGVPDDEDKAAATLMVEKYNEAQAALDPPGAELPYDNPGKLGLSYQTVLADVLKSAHESYARQAAEEQLVNELRGKWHAATKAQREAAIAALG